MTMELELALCTRIQHKEFILSPQRAKELIEWMHWENGMCGCLGAKKPQHQKETTQEKEWLLNELKKQPGNACLAHLLYEIANGK